MEKYDTPQEVCEYLTNVTPNLLAQWRFQGVGPAFIKPSPRKILYRRSAVEAWLLALEQKGTQENVSA